MSADVELDEGDILVRQGETLYVWFDLRRVVTDVNGAPILDGQGALQYEPFPLSGYTAHMQIRASEKPDAELFFTANSLGTADGGTITIDPAKPYGRRLLLRGLPAKTKTIPKTGFYDVLLIKTADPTERVFVAEGKAVLDKRVTEV